MFKQIIKAVIPEYMWKPIYVWQRNLRDDYATKCYAWDGADMIVNRIFKGKKHGFYVDVGSHNPVYGSNTYLFYKKGWRGINIDANPGSMRSFNVYRPRDINVEAAISHDSKPATYYMFKESMLNTLSEDVAKEQMRKHNQLIGKKELPTYSLSGVLSKNIPKGTDIDFMNVDVEGLDLDVLESNDWNRYSPKAIIVEDHGFNLEHPRKSKIYVFLTSKGYSLHSKTESNLFFVKK